MPLTEGEGSGLDRRAFARLAGGGALAACAAELAAAPARRMATAPPHAPKRALMIESFGIQLDMVPLPLSSLDTAHAEMPNIMLGRSPERDREIDDICRMIRNAARAGIPALKYNMSVLGVVRTEPTAGRGGARYSTFKYEKAAQDDPGREIFDVIRHFGRRKKIFNVHFRNIQGRFLAFRETFIDDGDVDMLEAVRVYREVGYDGMLMPDHVPSIAGDAEGAQAFAYTFGYIKALVRAVHAEPVRAAQDRLR